MNTNKNDKNEKNEKKNPISPLISEYENIQNMEQPLTKEEGESLIEDYSESAVKEILMQMENWKPLTKKNKSANLTARNWLRKRNGQQKTEKIDFGL